MSINTVFASKIAEYSQGRQTPGLWGIAKVALCHYEPTVLISTVDLNNAVKELSQIGRTDLAEKLCQAMR